MPVPSNPWRKALPSDGNSDGPVARLRMPDEAIANRTQVDNLPYHSKLQAEMEFHFAAAQAGDGERAAVEILRHPFSIKREVQ